MESLLSTRSKQIYHIVVIDLQIHIIISISRNFSYVYYACKHTGCIRNEVGAEESLCSHALQLHYYLPTIDIEPHLPCFLPFIVVIVSWKKKNKKEKKRFARRRWILSKEIRSNQSNIGRSRVNKKKREDESNGNDN